MGGPGLPHTDPLFFQRSKPYIQPQVPATHSLGQNQGGNPLLKDQLRYSRPAGLRTFLGGSDSCNINAAQGDQGAFFN